MRMILTVLALLALMGASPPALAKSLSPKWKAQLETNLARGDLLYEYDQAAWHTTDAYVAAVPETLKKEIRGYIVTPDRENLRATYYGIDNGREYAVYSATWDGKGIVRPTLYNTEPRPSVSAEEHRLIEARNVATNKRIFEKLGFCSEGTPNVAVIPGATPADPISVYLMTSQTENGIWPLGGHHRIDVKDGRIVGQRAFTKSCVSLGGGARKDEAVVMMMVTHLLDPIPTEIHAFTVHTSGISVGVGTSDGSLFTLTRKNGKIVAEQDK